MIKSILSLITVLFVSQTVFADIKSNLQSLKESSFMEKRLIGSWEIKEGWFSEDKIILAPLDRNKHKRADMIDSPVISFLDNGIFVINLPPSSCAIGVPMFSLLKWNFKNDVIRIKLEGENRGTDRFIYDVDYTIANRDDGSITFLRRKRYNVQVWDLIPSD